MDYKYIHLILKYTSRVFRLFNVLLLLISYKLGTYGPLTECLFNYMPSQAESKDAATTCIHNKVVLRQLVALIAKVDLIGRLTKSSLVEILCAIVPTLIENEMRGINDGLAVTFMYHLVREYQRESEAVQFLVQQIVFISGSAASKFREESTIQGNRTPKMGIYRQASASSSNNGQGNTSAPVSRTLQLCPAPLEPFDVNYAALFSQLAPDTIMIFISALLTETSVVLTCKHPQMITDIFEAAQALVAPYEWQCFYIPIVREDMMEPILGAPFPKLLGWVTTERIQNPVEVFVDAGYEGLLIDLDSGTLSSYPEAPIPGQIPNSLFIVQKVPASVMVTLPDRFWERVFQNVMGITLEGSVRTVALDNSSDAEVVEFLHKTEVSRFKEIQWTFTSVLVSLFKNLRQHISVNTIGKAEFNKESFLASFKQDHQDIMTRIVESQVHLFKFLLF